MNYALSDFLKHIDPHILAAEARNNGMIRTLSGKDLIKRHIERESHNLQLRNQRAINLVTNKIWNSKSFHSQKRRFINLANKVNNINQNIIQVNNNDTLYRIEQIKVHQETANILASNFFNGTE